MNQKTLQGEKKFLKEVQDFLSFRTVGLIVVSSSLSNVLGTGTFVKFNDQYGILTCAHVAVAAILHGEIGLCRIDIRGTRGQSTKFAVNDSDVILCGKKPFRKSGPDLALIYLPQNLGSSLAAILSPVDWKTEKDKAILPPPKHTNKSMFLVGMLAEFDSFQPASETSERKLFRHECKIHNIQTKNGSVTLDGFDYFDAEIDPKDYSALPNSFGGTSGGATWQFFVTISSGHKIEIVERRLVGIAFYEERHNTVLIRCHGPESIYRLI